MSALAYLIRRGSGSGTRSWGAGYFTGGSMSKCVALSFQMGTLGVVRITDGLSLAGRHTYIVTRSIAAGGFFYFSRSHTTGSCRRAALNRFSL